MSLQAVQREYDTLAAVYDRRWSHYVQASTALAHDAARRSRLPEAPHILDVGCGTGVLLDLLANDAPAAQRIGLDVTPAMLQQARSRLVAHRRQPLLVEGSGEALPLLDDSVDLVVSTSALHYMSAG